MSSTNQKNIKTCKTESLNGQLTEQLQMAGTIQRDFLPRQFPKIAGIQWSSLYVPAEWVSGDIYDVTRIDEEHIGFYIADVVGHGIGAAFLTMFIKQALVMRETRGEKWKIFSPAEVMSNLNKRIIDEKLSCQPFVTACYCLLNTTTMQLRYCRAGHPYPVIMHKDRNTEYLEGPGSLLGIFEEATFSEQTVYLQPGDKLLLYSDGLEPVISDYDENGRAILNKAFTEICSEPIHEMSKLLSIMTTESTGNCEPDDMTMIAMQIPLNN